MTNKYDWKKTFKKGLWVFAEVIVAGILVFVTDEQVCLAVVPLLEAARNYLKHRKD